MTNIYFEKYRRNLKKYHMKYYESFEMRNVYGKFRKIKRNRTSNIPSIRKRETSAFENLKESKKKKKKSNLDT